MKKKEIKRLSDLQDELEGAYFYFSCIGDRIEKAMKAIRAMKLIDAHEIAADALHSFGQAEECIQDIGRSLQLIIEKGSEK